MEKENLEALLIDYIDGNLTESESETVRQELQVNADARTLYEQLKEVMQVMDSATGLEPSPNLKQRFDRELETVTQSKTQGKVFMLQPFFYRVAAAVLLVVLGGGVGFWISKRQNHAQDLAAIKKEMAATKLMLMTMLDNQQSASQRLLGATVAFNDVEKADDDIVEALVHAMNEDSNTNVRIAALEALGKFYKQPHVRKALIESLNSQKDPLVQIALIRLMIEMKEQHIRQYLEQITTDEESLPAVKDEAHAGLIKLS